MATLTKKKKKRNPPQSQKRQPGRQSLMHPEPVVISESYKPAGKLEGRVAIITGGDSGIGRSVAVGFASEGAQVVIAYLEEDKDAEQTRAMIEEYGGECELIRGDVGDTDVCEEIIRTAVDEFGRLDVLVNNAAEQHVVNKLEDITDEQLERTFQTNFFSYFRMTRAALPYLRKSKYPSIINTASITAYKGHDELVDYSATKGAIVSFTRSLSTQLAEAGVRVNAVAPGPIWTPLIPASFSKEKVAKFGLDTPLGRPGQPAELIGAFVYLASDDSSYVTGQVIHVNGGEIING